MTQTRRLSTRLILAQGADVATLTAFFLWVGPSVHAERNPLVLAVMALGGIAGLCMVKVGVALIIGWRREHPASKPRWWSKPITNPRFLWVETVVLSTATASGIVGAGFNSAAIIHATTGFAIRLVP